MASNIFLNSSMKGANMPQTPVTSPNRSVLYHVKSHGVTRELTDNWNHAFSAREALGRKLGHHNVELITIRDARTPAQRFPDDKKGH